MRIQFMFLFLAVLVLSALAAWGAEDATALMTRSDAKYYYPTQAGMRDLAVDLTIQEFAAKPVGRDARITYYYLNEEHQRTEVANVPDQYAKFRAELAAFADPLSSYLVPRPSSLNFDGLNLRAEKAYRQFAGTPGTTYFQLIGTAKDTAALIREYRVLLDADGLARQIESIFKDGGSLIARVDNVLIGDKWHISKVTTRLAVDKRPQWRIESVEYTTVDGFVMPSKICILYRDDKNQPVRDAQEMTVLMTNYRINKGIAAALFPNVPTPAPAPAPEKPVEKPATPPAVK